MRTNELTLSQLADRLGPYIDRRIRTYTRGTGLAGTGTGVSTGVTNPSTGNGGAGTFPHDIVSSLNHSVSGNAGDVIRLATAVSLGLESPVVDGKTNPGDLLITDSNGDLWLRWLNADKVVTGEINATTLAITSSVETSWTTDFNTSNYVSGTTGIGMNESAGSIDARLIEVDEMIVETFTAAVKRALAGSLTVVRSESLTSRPVTLVDSYVTPTTLYVFDIPGWADFDAFIEDSWVMIPYSRVVTAGDPLAKRGYSARSDAYLVDSGVNVYVDEDFEGFSDEGIVSGIWFPTANSNSMLESSANWKFDDVSGNMTLAPLSGASNGHVHYAPGGVRPALSDIQVTGRVRFSTQGAGWGITAYSQYPNTDEYVRVRRYASGDVEVVNHGYDDPASGGSFTPSFSVDTWYAFKMEVETVSGSQTDVRFRIWQDGTSEPGTWDIDCSITGVNQPRPGTVGVWGYNSGNGVWYDDLLVQDLGSTATAPSTTATLNVRPIAGDTHVLAMVSWEGPSTAPATVPAGMNLIYSGAGPGSWRYAVYWDAVTTESGPTDYTWAMTTSDDELLVSMYALRNLDDTVTPVLGSSDNWTSTPEADWSQPYATETGGFVYPNLFFKFDRRNGFVTVPSKTVNMGSAISQSNRHSHFASMGVPKDGKIPIMKLVNHTDEYGVRVAIKFKSLLPTGSSTGLEVRRAYGTVTKTDPQPGDLEDGEQAWDFTLLSSYQINDGQLWEFTPDSPGGGAFIPGDTPVLNYGGTGDGVVDIKTNDATGSPYMQLALVGLHPAEKYQEVVTRVGRLSGITGEDSFGLWASFQGRTLEVSSVRAALTNIPFYLSDGESVDTVIDATKGIRLRSLDYGIEYDGVQVPVEFARSIDWDYSRDLTGWLTENGERIPSIAGSIQASEWGGDRRQMYIVSAARKGTGATGDADNHSEIKLETYNPWYTPKFLPLGNPLADLRRRAYVLVSSPTDDWFGQGISGGAIELNAGDLGTISLNGFVNGPVRLGNFNFGSGNTYNTATWSWVHDYGDYLTLGEALGSAGSGIVANKSGAGNAYLYLDVESDTSTTVEHKVRFFRGMNVSGDTGLQVFEAIGTTSLGAYISANGQEDSFFNKSGGRVMIGTASGAGGLLYLDNDTANADNAIRIVHDPSLGATLQFQSYDNGTGDGPFMLLGRNSNASTPAPASIALYQSDGGVSTIWADDNGDLRENTLGGAGVRSTEKNGGELVGEQPSSERFKKLMAHMGEEEWPNALARVERAARNAVHKFQYTKHREAQGVERAEVYQGVVLERGAEHYGKDKYDDPKIYPYGKALNEVNAIADLMQALALLNQRIEALEAALPPGVKP